ncbi:MAG: EAL domain-containing protein, partial [Spirochaeta sp.]
KIVMQSRRIVGAEALVRWKPDGETPLPPSVFIPIAEETGIIHDLGQLVLEQICRQIAEWKALGFTIPPIAVNISPLQLNEYNFPNKFLTTLQGFGLPARQIIIEITETAFLHDRQHSTTVLQQLQNSGIAIHLDDFGTGYSSFSYLSDLPLDAVKIDKSFINRCISSEHDDREAAVGPGVLLFPSNAPPADANFMVNWYNTVMSNLESNLKESTILLVDDNRQNLSLLYRILSAQGFRVLIAQDAISAKSIIHEEQPDLILLDVMLPDQSGFDVCNELKQDPRTADIRVLFVSALSEVEDILGGFQAGGVDYITKPFHIDEVLARITTHLTLVHQRKMLEQVNHTKDRLLSIIAHDIRGPIGGFIGASQVIEQGVKNGDMESLLEIGNAIKRSAESTHEMLDDLLAWVRAQENSYKPKPETVQLEEIVDRVIGVFSNALQQKSLEVKKEAVKNAQITADLQMLETILRNLVSNAIKFCNTGDTITVQYSADTVNHYICICDTGIGMDQEQQQKIFRADAGNQRRGTFGESSSGYGILLVKDYIEAHQGRIEVHGSPNEGSCFTICLPKQL